MIDGTLYRIVWCRIFYYRANGALATEERRVSYLYECPGRRSINATTWYHSPFTHFRFFNEEDRPVWLSVFVEEVEEVEEIEEIETNDKPDVS